MSLRCARRTSFNEPPCSHRRRPCAQGLEQGAQRQREEKLAEVVRARWLGNMYLVVGALAGVLGVVVLVIDANS